MYRISLLVCHFSYRLHCRQCWAQYTLRIMLKVCSDGFWVWFSADQFTIFLQDHDDVIKWKQFPRCWPFLRRIHRSPVNSPHKGQWRGALMLSLIHTWRNGWVNNGEAGDLRRHRVHYDLTVMITALPLHESCEPSDCLTVSLNIKTVFPGMAFPL